MKDDAYNYPCTLLLSIPTYQQTGDYQLWHNVVSADGNCDIHLYVERCTCLWVHVFVHPRV